MSVPDFTVSIDGAKLFALRQRLRDAGARGLERELNKALKEAAKPIVEAERRAALAIPAARPLTPGGLRETLADNVKAAVGTRRRAQTSSVRIRDRAPLAKATQATRGWRHPVFGNRNVWVLEELQPDWFRRTAMHLRREVDQRIRIAAQRVARQIAGR